MASRSSDLLTTSLPDLALNHICNMSRPQFHYGRQTAEQMINETILHCQTIYKMSTLSRDFGNQCMLPMTNWCRRHGQRVKVINLLEDIKCPLNNKSKYLLIKYGVVTVKQTHLVRLDRYSRQFEEMIQSQALSKLVVTLHKQIVTNVKKPRVSALLLLLHRQSVPIVFIQPCMVVRNMQFQLQDDFTCELGHRSNLPQSILGAILFESQVAQIEQLFGILMDQYGLPSMSMKDNQVSWQCESAQIDVVDDHGCFDDSDITFSPLAQQIFSHAHEVNLRMDFEYGYNGADRDLYLQSLPWTLDAVSKNILLKITAWSIGGNLFELQHDHPRVHQQIQEVANVLSSLAQIWSAGTPYFDFQLPSRATVSSFESSQRANGYVMRLGVNVDE